LLKKNSEFPAGTLELGESPLESIKREVQEESGYSAKRWDNRGEMLPCPGYSDETIHLFLARDLTKLKKKPEGDADEDIEVLKIAPEKLNKIIASGEESLDGKTITAWFRACQLLNIR
jgi:ADP-ribose pyrophosphatase